MQSISEKARAKLPVSEMPAHEQDIVERFRIVAEEWADADAAHYMLDNTRTSVRDEIELKLLQQGGKSSTAKMLANTSKEYLEHVQKTADAKREANILRARMDYLRMREKRAERREINQMSERKLARAT